MVLELVGGGAPVEALRVLKPGGILGSTLPPTLGDIAEGAQERDIRLAGLFVEADRMGMAAVANLVAKNQLKPTIVSTFPLQDADKAQAIKLGPGETVLTLS